MDINNRHSNNSFGSATNVYFYTTEGKRILNDDNIRKCERYVVRNLNCSNNIKNRNYDLVRTFETDRKHGVQDVDYLFNHVARSFYSFVKNKSAGFVTLLSGKDARDVSEVAKGIGISKSIAKDITGQTKSFETSYNSKLYRLAAEDAMLNNGVYKNGERQAFGVQFKPVYKRNGELKKFEYVRSGYFDETKITQ